MSSAARRMSSVSKPVLALNSIRGQSGKHTLIEQLELSGLHVFRVAFADVLKEECSQVLVGGPGRAAVTLERAMHSSSKDIPVAELCAVNIAKSSYRAWLLDRVPFNELMTPRSPRLHLQQYGTEYIREHLGKKSYWLDQGCEHIAFALSNRSNADVVVVTDMRLPNEYDRMFSMDARMVRIVRNWFNPNVDTQSYHQSDISLMAHRFDALVVNEWGKPEAMYDQIKEFL